ncbi:hypothetical protein JCM5350_001256 [Sporobolomyces pararoseus]
MSVADGELSTVLPANNSEPSMTPPTTSYRSRITLETLPNELISAIVLRLGSFILPPLSKRLLPFHRSQLYREVNLDLTNYHKFKRTLELSKDLNPFVESLVLDTLISEGEKYRKDPPSRQSIKRVVSSLSNLKSLALTVEPRKAIKNYPSKFDFDRRPRLERYLVKSFFCEMQDLDRDNEISPFNWSILSEFADESWRTRRGKLYEDKSDPEVVVELERLSNATFGLRYFTGESTETQIDSILSDTPFSKLEIVVLTHQVHLDRLLSTIGTPSLLTHLSLLSLDRTMADTPREPTFISRFPNITHLALGGTSLPKSLDFYDSLRSLPLVSLHLGPHTPVQIQPLIDLISLSTSNSKPTTFKHLVLDNINARKPSEEKEEYAKVADWVFPDWTTNCSREKVGELRELAKKLEIQVDGTTFEGLDVTRSAPYKAALERASEREEERFVREEEEEEEEEEEDVEEELELEFQRYYAGRRPGRDGEYVALHEEICGCHRDYDSCWTSADEMDWPRRRSERDWY